VENTYTPLGYPFPLLLLHQKLVVYGLKYPGLNENIKFCMEIYCPSVQKLALYTVFMKVTAIWCLKSSCCCCCCCYYYFL